MSKSKGAKESLKAIAASVKAQKYDDAIQEAQNLLASDPKNYQAYVRISSVADMDPDPAVTLLESSR
jgi:hypothetical protein